MSISLKSYVAENNSSVSPQNVPTPGRSDEVRNDAGGYVFSVSDKSRLERFLILGIDGGSYYVGKHDFVKNNVEFLRKLIANDEKLVVDTAVSVSDEGRAFSNSPAIFALALVLCEGNDKAYARAAVNKIVRTGTHLFEFVGYIKALGKNGRAQRSAIASWYTSRDDSSLAYQAVKYRNRHGFTHGDVLKISHANVSRPIARFMLDGEILDTAPEIIKGFSRAQKAVSVEDTLKVLTENRNLSWETLRTEHLTDVKVWKKLFYNNQLNGQALFRNIVRLAKLNAFNDMKFAADYAARLVDENMLAKTRMHPVSILNAIVVFEEGQIQRTNVYYVHRSKDWVSSAVISAALNEAFYKSFKYVEPANKRTYIGVDVSGSMAQAVTIGSDLSAAQAAGAIAMTIARTEPMHIIKGFTGGWSRKVEMTDLGINANTQLSDAMRKVQKSNFGSTDCALPVLDAMNNNIEVDTFITITDNDTWAGNIKPTQALEQYRNKTGINAKLIVLGTVSNGFTIADPTDPRQLDVVGFDANVPKIVAEFSAGRL